MRAPALAAAKACGGLNCFVDQQHDELGQRCQYLEAFMFGLTFGVAGHLISPPMAWAVYSLARMVRRDRLGTSQPMVFGHDHGPLPRNIDFFLIRLCLGAGERVCFCSRDARSWTVARVPTQRFVYSFSTAPSGNNCPQFGVQPI